MRFIYTYIYQKEVNADFKSEAEWRAVVDFLETLQRLLDRSSVPHQSEHLGYWPAISQSALWGPASGRWDVEGLHMFTPSCLTFFVISPSDCSSVVGSTWICAMRPKQTGWTCLLLTGPHKHTHAFTCTHQSFCPVCVSLAWVLCCISSTSPQVAVLLVNSTLYR